MSEVSGIEVKFRRRFPRKMSTFLCQEMMYDYVLGRLDQERRKDLEKYLETDPVAQRSFRAIQSGLQYCHSLQEVSVDEQLIVRLGEAESVASITRRYMKWMNWPDTLRWSVVGLAISFSVAGVVAVIPWEKIDFIKGRPTLPSNVLIVADIPSPKPDEASEVSAGSDTEDVGDEGDVADASESSGDFDEGPSAPVAPAKISTNGALPSAAQISSALNDGNHVKKPSSGEGPSPAVGSGNVSHGQALTSAGVSAGPTDAPRKSQGYVLRAFMTLQNVSDVTPEIRQLIQDLGGEKAGEVELGWKKGNGSYFHFSLPEKNDAEFVNKLKVYGPVRISKDPHPRIMPPGLVRYILWIDSGTNSSQ